MRKDESNVREWCKHTKNVYGGRRRVNKGVRKNVKLELKKGDA